MPNPDKWWSIFFDGVTLDLWRQVFPEEQSRQEAEFIEKALGVHPPARILDVPCGEGRLARPLASKGYEVTGVDYSPDFLADARAKSDQEHLKIEWRQGDMRHLDLPAERFDGAYCMGGSFGYFDDAGNADFLRSVASILKPGAHFVLDASRLAENVLQVFQKHESAQIVDILFEQDNRYNHETGRMETEYTFTKGGQIHKKSSSDRIYTYREQCQLLADAGFKGIQGYASFNMEPFQLGARALYLVSRKI